VPLPSPVFSPAAGAWTMRPGDVNDVLFAQTLHQGQREGGVALFGIPYDGAVIGRPGARMGPDAIRGELQKLRPWTLGEGDTDVPLADWGNVRIPYGDVNTVHQAVETAALAVLEAGAFPLALGGDHSLTFPLVKAHEGRRQKIGVINLDAHLDVRDVVNGALNSGQSFGRLLDLGLVPGPNFVEVGIRDFANSSWYANKARKAGATLLGATEWQEKGLEVIEHAVELASDGTDGVYLSIDIDVLDQAHGPGVSAPTPGGINTTELFQAVRFIAKRAKLVGADLVELAPPLDENGRTVRAAAYTVAHLLAGLGARR